MGPRILWFFLIANAHAGERCLAIDGDTLVCNHQKVRLTNVYAAELNQAGGPSAPTATGACWQRSMSAAGASSRRTSGRAPVAEPSGASIAIMRMRTAPGKIHSRRRADKARLTPPRHSALGAARHSRTMPASARICRAA
jgi:hypothetical protein